MALAPSERAELDELVTLAQRGDVEAAVRIVQDFPDMSEVRASAMTLVISGECDAPAPLNAQREVVLSAEQYEVLAKPAASVHVS